MFKTRAIALLFAIITVVLCAAPEAEAKKHPRKRAQTQSRSVGTNDARYADIVMNPVTGEIYRARNADARRYPASLTKMMTLYLLFEALDRQKTTLDARLDISALAARQPQTNLALDAGDSIEVETAIKALVVRSANDVAVVVAEALGGDVDNFARMMTAKARALGMTGTVFRNPNGLPNSDQYTTARDMAKLGIALKRDFPRYYRYFSTLQFSHNGVTYYTHNRVMLRYAGVDGIKTGYIGASGFNLVSSVVRGGRPLVGVVMGGASGRWRDDQMIRLLDDTYAVVARRGAVRGRNFPANLPLLPGGKRAQVGAPTAGAAVEAGSALAASPAPEGAEVMDAAASASGDAAVTAPSESISTPPSPFAVPEAQGAGERGWGIQVGAFSTQALAIAASRSALQIADKSLISAKIAAADPASGTTPVHRARLENLTQNEARKACEMLIANNSPCFIYQAAP
ncbi:MAG: D-alanyl-D-alanine carboxypeptidase family protein [Alphaproteobacteria bacterium]|nr:D-alanyl-D-alanine carboxypeptidase family protein [Alphaproteobacteria bacterium]